MKINFIQPYYHNVWECIGIGYIISYCKENYVGDLDIGFYQSYFDSDETIIENSKDCDVVCFSCTSPSFMHGVSLSKKIKVVNPKVISVFGGWHISALKAGAIIDGVDHIIIGEGEKAFLKFLNGDRRQIICGEKIGFNELPFPDRKTIKNHRTIDLCESINGLRTASFQSSRVCPMSCVFCSEKIMTGRYNKEYNPIRIRDPKDLCDEIQMVADEYKLNYIKFVDATFDISPEIVINFCKEKIKRRMNVQWEAMLHANFINEEMIYWMKESHCNQVNIGCESGSEKILKLMHKGTNLETIKNVFDLLKKYRIKSRAFFLLGMPQENKKDIFLTEQLVKDIAPDYVGFTILCPYPGCELYDHEKMKDIDWAKTDEYSNDFWRNENFSNEELKKIQFKLKNKFSNIICERQKK